MEITFRSTCITLRHVLNFAAIVYCGSNAFFAFFDLLTKHRPPTYGECFWTFIFGMYLWAYSPEIRRAWRYLRHERQTFAL
jgi:hypothetical protein